MQFETNLIYHIYNQGNNKEPIFFQDGNYLFFLKKMRTFILPYADFLCYCLMPNHFHWLVYVRQTEVELQGDSPSGGFRGDSPDDSQSPGESPKRKFRSLNDSIAIMLRSYTRAINKQQQRTGSLFREETKAKSGWIEGFITVDRYRKGPFDFRAFPDDEYGWNCFQYIHNNPKSAGLVKHETEWPFSSARDFAGLRQGTLCNQELARQLLLLPLYSPGGCESPGE